MFGSEELLGSPHEDMTSMSALYGITGIKKLLLNLGWGVDTFHGVNHYRYLENIATVAKQGGFLGAFSLLADHDEGQRMEKMWLSCQPENSIVTSSVVSAVHGEFGDVHHPATKHRTGLSKLFISPLMSLYWCFHLDVVCKNVVYMSELQNAKTYYDVDKVIQTSRAKYVKQGEYVGTRPDKVIPQ